MRRAKVGGSTPPRPTSTLNTRARPVFSWLEQEPARLRPVTRRHRDLRRFLRHLHLRLAHARPRAHGFPASSALAAGFTASEGDSRYDHPSSESTADRRTASAAGDWGKRSRHHDGVDAFVAVTVVLLTCPLPRYAPPVSLPFDGDPQDYLRADIRGPRERG